MKNQMEYLIQIIKMENKTIKKTDRITIVEEVVKVKKAIKAEQILIKRKKMLQ
jgi:hypothetical protein